MGGERRPRAWREGAATYVCRSLASARDVIAAEVGGVEEERGRLAAGPKDGE